MPKLVEEFRYSHNRFRHREDYNTVIGIHLRIVHGDKHPIATHNTANYGIGGQTQVAYS